MKLSQALSLISLFGMSNLSAETITWTSPKDFAVTAEGINSAIKKAGNHFKSKPDDIVVIQIPKGEFKMREAPVKAGKSEAKGILDIRNIMPGEKGRLIIQGEGMEQTTLIFDDTNHAINGQNIHRVTMADMHMTREKLTVSQGIVTSTAKGEVVLEIQPGFPTPGELYNDHSEQGRFLMEFTNSKTNPQRILENNEEIPWDTTKRVEGRKWSLSVRPRNVVPHYKIGSLVAIKSKSGGELRSGAQAYRIMSGTDFLFHRIKWTQKCRGVFRDFHKAQVVGCVVQRAPAVHGQVPCLATPGGGPQIGQPWDGPTSENLVKDCHFVGTGDDAIAFFNASGTISGNTVEDSLARGILVANSPEVVLIENTTTRCYVQKSKDYRMPSAWGTPQLNGPNGLKAQRKKAEQEKQQEEKKEK